ncbi:hypothetical protein PoB_006707700 [Plakobranchus ocellatus]|uniref:Plethodontid modulating factor n=1 Tax=Plakobranchus ocellatus TaxID=259542 RepID=A0AAV4D8V2_9GAST|nr:hypothetical protein PoB_006707700 [Plakobranchus ocellatus]
MKYVAGLFVALAVVSIADASTKKGCLYDGLSLLNDVTVDCSSLYNTYTDQKTGDTVCCEYDDKKPDYDAVYTPSGIPLVYCVCKS